MRELNFWNSVKVGRGNAKFTVVCRLISGKIRFRKFLSKGKCFMDTGIVVFFKTFSLKPLRG